jgi:hypothetical protein
MKRIILLTIVFIGCLNASCQNDKKLSDYFPDRQNKDTIITTVQLLDIYGRSSLDTIIALKYFFDNNVEKMHDIEIGYNVDENTYISTPYTKMVYPLYKMKNKDIYLLCFGLEGTIYLAFYDYIKDSIENTFLVVDFSDEYGNIYTNSTIFPNNYIVTIKITEKEYEKVYYILSKIDFNSHNFIELKKIKVDNNQNDYVTKANSFGILGISEQGELMENENSKKEL